MSERGWIGVDLDRTLAYYDHFRGLDHIGAPITPMVDRVKRWLAAGRDVRIFTARACPGQRDQETPAMLAQVTAAIEAWCREHIGKVLPITATKDFLMEELWDDRAVSVVPNKGVSESYDLATRAIFCAVIAEKTFRDIFEGVTFRA